jgi:hypothetical protein
VCWMGGKIRNWLGVRQDPAGLSLPPNDSRTAQGKSGIKAGGGKPLSLSAVWEPCQA